MSLKLSVTQAQLVDKGAQIPGLVGRVKKVFPQKQGTRPNTEETYVEQGIVICDTSNPKAEVVLAVYDQAPYDSSIEGKTIEVTPGAKGGLRGGGSYENKKKEIVYKVQASKMCTLEFGGAAAPARPTQSAQPSPQRPAAPAAPAPRPSISWADFLAAEKLVMVRCIQTASEIAAETNEAVAAVAGSGFEPTDIVKIAEGLRVGASKLGLDINSPNSTPKPTQKPAAPARPAAAPTDEAPVADGEDGDVIPF